MKNEQINNLQKLLNEIKTMASLYDLHMIEIENIFSDSIIKAYELNIKEWIVTINSNHQIVFLNTIDKKEKIYNISIKMFTKIFKLFNDSVQKRSEYDMKKSFKEEIKKLKFIELNILKRTKKRLYLIPINFKILNSKFIFVHNIMSKIEDDYISANDTFFIKLSKNNIAEITNSELIKKEIELDCNILDYNLNKLIIEHFLNKIYEKSNKKILLKIKFFNKNSNTIHLACNSFIPKTFTKYIENYILINTSYKTNLIKK